MFVSEPIICKSCYILAQSSAPEFAPLSPLHFQQPHKAFFLSSFVWPVYAKVIIINRSLFSNKSEMQEFKSFLDTFIIIMQINHCNTHFLFSSLAPLIAKTNYCARLSRPGIASRSVFYYY